MKTIFFRMHFSGSLKIFLKRKILANKAIKLMQYLEATLTLDSKRERKICSFIIIIRSFHILTYVVHMYT